MKDKPMARTKILYYFIGFIAVANPGPAQAFLDNLFKRSNEKAVSAEQLTGQSSAADSQLARAQEMENSGKMKQAGDAYRGIVRSYPRTEAAAEAQFRYAKILEASGEHRKAFDEYQKLVTNFRNTTNFNEAITRQYAIADTLSKSEKKGFLGIGSPVQPSKLVEMFKNISNSAPQSEFAPRSLLSIGHVHSKAGETVKAITAFQEVVNKYGGTPQASEAQYEIFRLRGVEASKSNSPVQDRVQMDAGLEFVTQNPDDARTAEIKSGMQEIEDRSMEKQYNTGLFYEKSGKPDAARVSYRAVAANPNTPWAAKAQERLQALDNASQSVQKRAGFFGSNPQKKGAAEMRTTADSVVPLPSQD